MNFLHHGPLHVTIECEFLEFFQGARDDGFPTSCLWTGKSEEGVEEASRGEAAAAYDDPVWR